MCHFLIKRLILPLLILVIPITASSQQPIPRPCLDSIIVSFITCSPGSLVYELEGHSALRIQAGEEFDIAFNYGIFDFSSPNFLYRFVTGATDYRMVAYPFDDFMKQYRRQGRSVTQQTLNLNNEQSRRLLYLLLKNAMPENCVYRYNFVKDNCATRPIAIIEKAIGDTIRFIAPEWTHGWTFRDEMRHFHRNHPWYQFGIDLALGKGIDYPISEREKGFAPDLLMTMLNTATISDSCGLQQPLVTSTSILYPGNEAGIPASATPFIATPMAISLAILAFVLIISFLDIRHKRITKSVDTILFSAFGLAGCLIAFLTFLSTHYATSPNYLLVWLNPLCFIVAICIHIKSCQKLVRLYEIANFVALFLLVTTWHCLGQEYNMAFIPLLLSDAILSARYIYLDRCAVKKNNA